MTEQKTPRPALGQPVRTCAIVNKRRPDGKQVVWRRVERDVTGIYTGWRLKKEGRWKRWYWDSYENDEFETTGYVTVWLITYSESANPVCALPEDVTLIDGGRTSALPWRTTDDRRA